MTTFLDFLCYGIIAYNFIAGIFRGLVKELFKMFAVIFGILFAYIFAELLTGAICSHWNWSYFPALIFSYLAIYAVAYLIITITGFLVNKFIEIALLGLPNRLAGGGFGIIKAMFFIMLIFYLLNLLPKFYEYSNASRFQKIYIIVSEQFNILDMKKVVDTTKKIKRLADDEKKKLADSKLLNQLKVMTDKKKNIAELPISEMENNEDIKNALSDKDLLTAIEKQDWKIIMLNHNFWKFLKSRD